MKSSLRGAVNVTYPAGVGSCSGAPPCGTEMTSFNGVGAYSNGQYQCTGTSCGGWSSTGLQWQCVELGQRYFNAQFGIAPVWPVSYALQMCTNYPSGVSQTSSPQPGDLIVFNWQPYGHVAVITGISGSSISVMEQNGDASGSNTYDSSQAECFLTA